MNNNTLETREQITLNKDDDIYRSGASQISVMWQCIFITIPLAKQGLRLSPFPRVETRFNTHNQNAFANAFLELLRYHRSLRLTSMSIQCVPEKKQTPETKGRCDQVPRCMTVAIPVS